MAMSELFGENHKKGQKKDPPNFGNYERNCNFSMIGYQQGQTKRQHKQMCLLVSHLAIIKLFMLCSLYLVSLYLDLQSYRLNADHHLHNIARTESIDQEGV